MRTIETILEYSLSEHEKTCLSQCGITNGVGGEGKNLEKALFANIELLPGYDSEKAQCLLDDIRELSIEHDLQFRLGIGYYKSNYKFACKLFHLLHWSGIQRLSIAIIAFFLLNKYGKTFYFSQKSV